MLVSYLYQDNSMMDFVLSFGIIFTFGLAIFLPVYNNHRDLRTRDGFLITALFWAVLGVAGALPLYLSDLTNVSLVDAVFESVSGLTTTGATVITGLDELPKSILFYRQQLQWLGGIGIVVIAVAILPMLGIGGGVLYYIAGMSAFDAIGHAFSTVAIGGFSTHDASMGFFDNHWIYLIAIIFMVLSGINFALHFVAWRTKNIIHYWRDSESQFYLCCLLLGIFITVSYLYFTQSYDFTDSLVLGAFELVSILTTTGFGVADYSQWPTFLPFMLFMFAFMGGCGGSTAGGMKVMRVILIFKQGIREIHRLIHPNAVIPIKVSQKPVPDRVVEAVWGFFAVYVISFMAIFMILLATGLDFTTAFSAVGATINNLGPGLGDVAAHYGDINDLAKWVLCFAMLLGRLEVFTLLVLLTPAFWRQ